MVTRRGLWRWLIGAAVAAVGLYVAAGTFAVHQMIERLLQVPTRAEIAASEPPTMDPTVIGYRGDPMTALGLPFADMALNTGHGTAPAWLIPAEGEVKGRTWAIYVHGISGRRENGYCYVSALHEAGFPVLLMSYRNDEGAPPSPQGKYGYGSYEWQELVFAVDYVRQAGASDVLLIGDSVGGAIIGQFFVHSDRGWGISAVILDSPALDFAARVNNALTPFNLPLTPLFTALAQRTIALQYGIDIADAAVIRELAAFPGPLLVIHGTGDGVIPVAISDRLVARRVGITSMLRTASDHLTTRKDHPALFDATLRAFLASLKTEAPR
jgi:pimeloyl-ACP methyl ester carboxylesterase